jgi:hypothetical protein
MSERICVLPAGQAAQLERQGKVPRCSWHHHCSEKEAASLCRSGGARRVQAERCCQHAKPSIVLEVKRDFHPSPTGVGALVCGGPQFRVWQLVR